MFEIQKKIVTDENARPIAVQIDYSDWLEIERQLALSHPRTKSDETLPRTRWAEQLKRYPPVKIEGGPLGDDIIRDRRDRI